MIYPLATQNIFPRSFVVLLLASAFVIPAVAQESQRSADSQTPPPAVSATQTRPSSTAKPAKEGFWGRVNPFASKKWVKRRTDPIKDQLSELDEVNARNAKDIGDVDSRAQAGIGRAQSTADAANQASTAAGDQARQASLTAKNQVNRVDGLNSTVNGLDSYRPVEEVSVVFPSGRATLPTDARKQLDELAAKVSGQPGYILELEAHSPAAGSAGIESSKRLAETVKRYLVTQDEIPVYRLHSMALGNARVTASTGVEQKGSIRTSIVQVRLMENSLAAQGTASLPPGGASLSSAERP